MEPDKCKTLSGQDTCTTDNGRKEDKDSNKKIVPGQIFSPCLSSLSFFFSLSLSLSLRISMQHMRRIVCFTSQCSRRVFSGSEF